MAFKLKPPAQTSDLSSRSSIYPAAAQPLPAHRYFKVSKSETELALLCVPCSQPPGLTPLFSQEGHSPRRARRVWCTTQECSKMGRSSIHPETETNLSSSELANRKSSRVLKREQPSCLMPCQFLMTAVMSPGSSTP
ncbi:peptidyl-prolyl cis-trans isomerase FKBP1B isoform X1 [Pteropus vampyrus]|uniref:Peptidyl-prolyl cis-trans isomerase FKBP1B isoform X1 n=1 Tax=Pteropus vampyrus TaxID=132908 RepID=A0A6P6CA88_PTEVA|nr:peptidyl-prolyl cis-trans isomerase FKBP1B isoform X1 [Pteropus vampyrus]